MKFGWLVTFVVAAAALALWQGAPVASADAQQTSLRAGFPDEQQPGKPVLLTAKLSDTTGKALGNQTVEFFIQTDVFGDRLMSVGKSVTDSGGTASVSYKPSTVGQQDVVAKFAGNSQYAKSEVHFQFTSVGPAHTHENAQFGLAPIRAVAPVGVVAIVAAVWIVILAVLLSTARGLRAGAPAAEAVRRRAEAAGLGSEASME